MRSVTPFNTGWTFHDGFDDALVTSARAGVPVTLPHNAVDLPFNYFDETAYQRRFTYQATLPWRPDFENREVALIFDAAMANATVWLNGTQVAAHPDGYTPFEARLTPHLRPGDNLVTVRIDGSENPEIPPFGGQIDYLTYAGLYRDVWLRITDRVWIDALKVETRDVLTATPTATVRCDLANAAAATGGRVVARLLDPDGHPLAETESPVEGDSVTLTFPAHSGIRLWDLDDPALYTTEVTLESPGGRDRLATAFGFRTAEFTPQGFLLNGRPLKIRGLNRHQSFPYVGYALGRRAQERDAEILKHDLRLNLVRTSHYPQSPWFLDHCDRIGLLVFEEIPGWQHIGGEGWKEESIQNVRRMIRRDWNHPSIVLWGVRINESRDAPVFYRKTNELARQLDPTRQTGGVRNRTESELLEDVYTMNDFILGEEELPGANRPRTPLRPPAEVTGLPHPVPYLVTEFNGHMYPTKRIDPELRQAEHVTRHLEVLNAAYGDPGIAGCIGWCMADYNTHRDFGAGDRVCYHGVLDMFREPKFAAWAYASQGDPAGGIVMKPVTYWTRGERNIGGVMPLIVLTNCDEIEFRYGDGPPRRASPDRETYPHLPHPPMVLDHRTFTRDELGGWGASWQDLTLTGYLAGEAVRTVHMVADPVPTRLEVAPDATTLLASEKDHVRVVVRALDQADQLLPFLLDPVAVTLAGPARLVGPDVLTLAGGTTGFWLESTGTPGPVALEVASPRFPPVTLTLESR